MPESNPIVVPLDGSKNGEAALAVAIQLARVLNAPLRLVHVVDGEGAKTPAALDRARELFRQYSDELVARLGGAGVSHAIAVVGGPAARTILDTAADARLVVLASHGRGGVRAAFLGSVADKVVRGATHPTLVVPVGAKEHIGGAIVVGVDGSPAAEQGLALARDLGAQLGSKLALVRAWHIPPPTTVEFAAYPTDLGEAIEDAAKAYLMEIAKEGEERYCVFASPIEAISEVADKLDAGLVVLTSHGKGFAHRIALGSVTDHALHSLKRPVLVVPVTHDGK